MEQYAGDGNDLESLPTIIIKITHSLVALMPILIKGRSEKRQLIQIITVFNYSGISLLGKTSDSVFTLPVSITGAENGKTVYQ